MSERAVALVGFGLGGRIFHAPLIDGVPGLRLAWIVTADAERAAEARLQYPDAAIVPDLDALLALEPIPGLVVVATPNHTHAAIAARVIDAGIPVVVDKPLASSSAEAATLVERAVTAGVPLTLFQNRRWDADHLTLQGLLDAGRLGTVLRFESRFERWRPGPVAPGWRNQVPAERGGGVLADLGAHLVDQALTLFGPVARVYAEIAALKGGPTDDDAFLACSHASGTISHLHVSALTAAPGPRMRVLGTEAAFIVARLDHQEAALRSGERPARTPGWGVEPEHNRGRLVLDEASVPLPSMGRWPAFYAELERALREPGRPLPVDPRDGVATLQVIEAARESAAAQATVTLPSA